MDDFGHHAINGHIDGQPFFMDTWGTGPFEISIHGKQYRFEDSDRFGPSILRRDLSIADRQPGSRSPFWIAYHLWRSNDREVDQNSVCVYPEPQRGTYWKDERGVSWHLTDPNYDPLGYVEVARPTGTEENSSDT